MTILYKKFEAYNITDIVLVFGLTVSIAIGSWIVLSNFQKSAVSAKPVGGRKIDLKRIKKQISEGELSGKEALFYKKIEIKR